MKTHFILNSRQNVLRQALLDLSEGDETTIRGLLDWQLEQGTSIKRLVKFGTRRLRTDPVAVTIAILILTNQLH